MNKKEIAISHLDQLREWYWREGIQRGGEFKLDYHKWVGELYRAYENLGLIISEKEMKPTSAIWGPSQTGKSTLIAGYIDGVYKGSKPVKNALYWEGGEYAFFSMPRDFQGDEDCSRLTVLNPYNGGMDATACITRFTTNGSEGNQSMTDPQFPVQLKFSDKKEVMLSLARGYDSQCIHRYPDRIWTLLELGELAQQIGQGLNTKEVDKPKRNVFEEAFSLCEVLEDLACSGLPKYRGLFGSTKTADGIRKIILSTSGLVSDITLLKSFRDEVLWDSERVIGNFYEELISKADQLKELSKNRKLYCSLEVASCFLDMDGYTMAADRDSINKKKGTKEERIAQIVSQMKIFENEKHVFIGLDKVSGTGLKAFESSEDFGIVQGLIQEVVVTLNLKNMEQSPFKSYVEQNDLLDFPGVERGGQSSDAAKIEFKELGAGIQALPWTDLFSKVLKRGKTASLFQGYAKRMSIGVVSIFQDLDNDKPNAQDLISGVKAWWRSINPDFEVGQGQEVPLPLNCVLTWWAKMLNESPLNSATIFGKNQAKYGQLGIIADPEITNIFAINDFSLPRGKLSDSTQGILKDLVLTMKNENEFLKMFNSQRSKSSFDSMMGFEKGGMDFFFNSLNSQLLNSGNNKNLLEDRALNSIKIIDQLFDKSGLIPKKKSIEKQRVESLKFLYELIESKLKNEEAENSLEIERSLKKLFNFEADELEPLSIKEGELNQSYLRAQFRRRSLFFTEFNDFQKSLGFESEKQLLDCWEALCLSIEPSLKEMSVWLRRMVKQRNQFNLMDNRKFLAVRMSNEFVSSASSNLNDLKDLDKDSVHTNRFIQSCSSRINELISVDVAPCGRPDQKGDTEILQIRSSYLGKFI